MPMTMNDATGRRVARVTAGCLPPDFGSIFAFLLKINAKGLKVEGDCSKRLLKLMIHPVWSIFVRNILFLKLNVQKMRYKA